MVARPDLDRLLKRGLRKTGVPGASLAVLQGDSVEATAAGVLNLETGVPATVDSVFQIGSITKVLTTTLIMRDVQTGRIDLDRPVIDVLPEFSCADKAARRRITPRHFLTHTSGVDGDFFEPTGRGDDSIARFVERAALLPQLFDPGAMHSYCNAGFAVLGRMLEVLHRKSFDALLREAIFKPLNMRHAMSLPEDALRFRCAIGHLAIEPGDLRRLRVAPKPYLAFGQKAAGSTPAMSVLDLMKFAYVHMHKGRGQNGRRILAARQVAAMRKPQIELPPHAPRAATAWGLGWILCDWQGMPVHGHDGGTLGQYAFLRIFPEHDLAIALLTNGGDATALYRLTFDEIAGRMAGVTEPDAPPPDADIKVDIERYTGTYQNIAQTITIRPRGGRLHLTSRDQTGELGTLIKNAPLAFIDPDTATLATGDEVLDRNLYRFSPPEMSTSRYLTSGFRQHRRVDGP